MRLRRKRPVVDGVSLIAAERKRQVEEEGWTADHDDQHDLGELALAAAVYATPPEERVFGPDDTPESWPWDRHYYRPSIVRILELVKAGALIAAEIDRLRRASGASDTGINPPPPGPPEPPKPPPRRVWE